jgi:hypothetical protein
MIERGEQLGFAFDARKAIWIVRERVEEHRDRHCAIEAGIAPALHRFHSARPRRDVTSYAPTRVLASALMSQRTDCVAQQNRCIA